MKQKYKVIVAFLFITFVSFFLFKPLTNIDYGHSNLHTIEDINEAVEVVKNKFDTFEGCSLYKLSYTSDSTSEKELKNLNAHAPEGIEYTDCIVLDSEFRSPIFGGGAWNANSMYYWSWTLVRVDNGPWELINWGYA